MASDLVRAHQLAQINNGVLAATMVLQLAGEFKAGKLSRDEFVSGMVASDLLTHQAAVRLATRFVQDVRAARDVDGVIVEPEFDSGASLGRALGTVWDLEDAQAKAPTTRDWDAEFAKIVAGVAGRADRAAKMSGRQLVADSAEASGRGWRRVSDGHPCSFCAMLVGRGPVYRSAESAGVVTGRSAGGKDYRKMRKITGGVDDAEVMDRILAGTKKGADGKIKGRAARSSLKRRPGEKYHDHCGCSVVEDFGDWEPTDQEQRFVDLYGDAVNACHAEGLAASEENVLAQMRELGHGIVNDAHVPKTQTGGSGGGRPPTPPRPIRGGPDEPTWAHRQAALRSDTSGERLEPHEIEFLERFEAQGHVAKWIPSGHFRPTNDFEWVGHGLQFELKTTRARYATIHGRIVDAASRAAKQGVTKENFVIDLGDESLTADLRSELANYNIGRRAYRLHELWVMADGRLIQIDLAAD